MQLTKFLNNDQTKLHCADGGVGTAVAIFLCHKKYEANKKPIKTSIKKTLVHQLISYDTLKRSSFEIRERISIHPIINACEHNFLCWKKSKVVSSNRRFFKHLSFG